MSTIRLTVVMTLVTAALGCAKPYHFDINRINESRPQSRAVITISDPQIYARETLVDDRRTEVTYLKGLIKDSLNKQFDSQLRRDVRSIAVLTGQLGIAFDPAKGLEYSRATELGEIDQQIKKTQLQTQLIQLQSRLREVQANPTPTGQTDTTPAVPAPPIVASPGFTETRRVADDLQKIASGLLAEMDKTSPVVRNTEVKSTPQEEFRDRQAYREELRAALAGVNLDDLHDLGGNALFRLQFRATVMPGEQKDKFGVGRFTVKPPMLSDEDLSQIYRTWLAHVNYRLNQRRQRGPIPEVQYEALGAVSGLFGIVYLEPEADACKKAKQRRDSNEIARTCVRPVLAVPPNDLKPLRVVYRDDRSRAGQIAAAVELLRVAATTNEDMWDKFEGALTLDTKCEGSPVSVAAFLDSLTNPPSALTEGDEARARAQTLSARALSVREQYTRNRAMAPPRSRLPDTVSETLKELKDKDPGLTVAEVVAAARNMLNSASAIVAAAQGLRDRDTGERDASATTDAQSAFDKFVDLGADLHRFLMEIGERASNKPCQAQLKPSPYTSRPAPSQFGDLLTRPPTTEEHAQAKAKDSKPATGNVYTYATAPVELSQRISTVASAAHAAQLAMALSATVPGKGLGADAAFGYLKAAVGKVEALERTPIIVGFSDRAAPGKTSLPGAPQFGWVFGPRVVVNPDKRDLELQHGVVNQQVSADLSVPGWWPRVDLELETAWIGNWHDVQGESLGPLDAGVSREQLKSVALPPNRADMDGLTTFLAQKTTGAGLARAQIDRVIPTRVSACAEKVTFLIQGRGIWRSTEVYFAGLRTDDVTVLPDMEGVAATFPLKGVLPRRPSAFEQPRLTVWTRNGTDSADIEITGGEKDGKPDCGDEALEAASPPPVFPPDVPTIVGKVSPESIGACDTSAVFFVTGTNLSRHARVYLGSKLASSVTAIGKDDKTLEIRFKDGPFVEGAVELSQGKWRLPLIVALPAGKAEADIALANKGAKCAVGPDKLAITNVLAVPPGPVDVCAKAAILQVHGTALGEITDSKLMVKTAGTTTTIPAATHRILKPANGRPVVELEYRFPTMPADPALREVELRLNGEAFKETLPAVCVGDRRASHERH